MANAYYNLAGWLRDVRSVLGDRTELADSYYWQLRDLVEELVDGLDESATEPDDEAAPPDVVVEPDTGGRVLSRSAGGRPRESRERRVAVAAPVGSVLPRDVQEARGGSQSDTVTVAAAGNPAGVARVSTVEVSLKELTALRRAASVPRATRVRKRTPKPLTPARRRAKVTK